jgi:poly(3-hydroxybutyrate) depolymerase
VAGLERPDMLLPVAGGLGVQGPDDLGAVAPIAGPMRHSGFRAAETAGRPVRIVAFIPGVADQDQRRRRGSDRRAPLGLSWTAGGEGRG